MATKKFKASIVRYGHGVILAESKDEAKEKAKYLQSDESVWVESNGSNNMPVYLEEIPVLDGKV